MTLRIGADELDPRDLTLLRSTARLHPAAWTWVESFDTADLWLVDPSQGLARTPLDRLDDARVVCLDSGPEAAAAGVRVLLKPLKAAHLLRVLDQISAAQSAPEPVAASAAPPAQAPQTPPWAGRPVRLLKSPNLARYPVSVELLGWLERMQYEPVDVDAIERTLPLDRDMLRDLLNDAARHGALVDAQGTPVAPMAAPSRRRKWW
ncbi:hypothetical protein G3580_03910 [Nitrogeniibacter mangrovi]|uniref:Uncharacterized protein n=1 Tax=Nitrogeniibacter mangrovi TaxID=2016596 RepID=A0A6C1B0F3_9RHOO|nr:hypothetical protein [Nitrogeniibacter mangrovi]QID16853.1 hypothetical protein G3580_03910 [Nitrogeniibacter mangrovi]